MLVLVVNAGSSSLKLRVIGDGGELRDARDLPGVERVDVGRELAAMLEDHPGVDAAGHRVVHGGARFNVPALLDDDAEQALAELADLAPLHNPPSLAAVHRLRELRPALPQVACFDTAFHAGMPRRAATYAVPGEWRDGLGVRRYGFHGLSHAWASRRAAALLGRPLGELRTVTAHVGAGASLAAVDGGRSVDTTMGFTPLEGLVMATRSGSVDPGAVLWAQRKLGLTASEVEDVLEHRSGLLGVSGISGDLREVTAAADAGHAGAQLAYEVYVYRLRVSVAAMAGALGGLDALAFTGGAGEASARLRADVCRDLGFLGVQAESAAPGHAPDPGGDRVASWPDGGTPVLVVRAREDLEIDRHVRALLARA